MNTFNRFKARFTDFHKELNRLKQVVTTGDVVYSDAIRIKDETAQLLRDFRTFVELVKQIRDLQKGYFKAKKQGKIEAGKELLEESKQAEIRLDAWVTHWLGELKEAEEPEVKQLNLF